MPNSFYQAPQAARLAVALTADELMVSALISRNLENDLLGGGGRGRTVNLKVPTALVARARDIEDVTNKIVLDYLAEQTVSVTLGTHAYSAVGLSEGDLSLNLEDFGAQVLAPQTTAVAEYVEDMVLNKLLTETETTGIDWDPATPSKTFTALRQTLRKRGVPQTNLNVLVGTDVYAALLDAKEITDAGQSGSTAALREAQVGRVRGFTVVESTKIPDGQIVAFHRDAYTLAVRAPKVPAGAPFGATVNEAGFALRYLRDYAADYTQDRSIVSTFCGIAKMPLYRVSRTEPTMGKVEGQAGYTVGSATVTADPAGAVVRIDTTTAVS